MRVLRGLIERCRCLLRRSQVENELHEEIEFHLARETARNRAGGMNQDEAARVARRDFGGVERVKELHRDERGVRWLQDFLGDVRFGLRGLRTQPGLAAVAVLALGLGIGGNAAVFSVLDALLIKPLPFADPEQLIVMWQVVDTRDDRDTMTPYDVVYYREHVGAFAGLAGIQAPQRVSLIAGQEPEQAMAARVTTDYFEVLGVDAARGRVFTPADEITGADLVVLSHRYWSSRFAADPEIVGRTVTIDTRPTVIVGVMPESFQIDFPARVDVWVPRVYTQAQLDMVNFWSDHVIARLAPGVTIAEARAEIAAVSERLYEETDRGFRADAFNPVPLHEEIVAEFQPALLTLLGAVVVVMLIACANVANLLLARNTQRQDELALRAALGAGRGRLTRQLYAESLALALAGALAAAGIGQLLLRSMMLLAPADVPRLAEVGMDWRVALFTGAIALGATVLFGTLPALRGGRSSATGAIAGSGSRGSLGRGERTLGMLVAAEAGLIVVLVFAAGAMLHRYLELTGVETGFVQDSRIAAKLVLPDSRYDTTDAIAAFVNSVDESLRSVPGVDAVGTAWTLPLSGRAITVRAPQVEGQPPREVEVVTGWDGVTPGYFEAAGIPVLEGRGFTAADDGAAVFQALIINQTMARELFGDAPAVGRFFAAGGNPPSMRWQIVGVVGDTVHLGLDQAPRPQIYQPQAQVTFAWTQFEILIASSLPQPLTLAPQIRRAVAGIDPQQPVAEIRTLDDVEVASIRHERFLLVLLGAFGSVALLLGAIGIYGVVGYSVARRRREMGLRLTLGARANDIRWLVLRQGLTPVAVGLALGAAVATAMSGVLESLLSGAHPPVASLLLPVAALVLLTAGAAVLAPMRRATDADPLESLRAD